MSSPAAGPGPRATEVEVEAEATGQRVDNFLFSRLKGVPRSRIYRALRNGEVRVNGGRVRPTRRLETGDSVRVPPLRTADSARPTAPPPALRVRLDRSVLFEDAGLLVLDKPSGLAVHGGSGKSLGLIEALREMRPDCRALELVHRLDRDTSGCLLIAKKRAVLLALHEQLRNLAVEKEYLALLAGRCGRAPFVVDLPLRKNTLRSGERVVRRDSAGKAARTRFEPLHSTTRATLVRVLPETGRTHQIRVHAALAGHPVAGDDKYGDRVFDASMRELGLRRLYLHCSAMTVEHPPGQTLRVQAPLPAELAAVATSLGIAPDWLATAVRPHPATT